MANVPENVVIKSLRNNKQLFLWYGRQDIIEVNMYLFRNIKQFFHGVVLYKNIIIGFK
jgi:hypothetical protein